jgi:hypothetical protein
MEILSSFQPLYHVFRAVNLNLQRDEVKCRLLGRLNGFNCAAEISDAIEDLLEVFNISNESFYIFGGPDNVVVKVS